MKRGSPGGERWLFTICANILKNKSAQRASTQKEKGRERRKRDVDQNGFLHLKKQNKKKNSNASVINWLVSTDANRNRPLYKCHHVHLKN